MKIKMSEITPEQAKFLWDFQSTRGDNTYEKSYNGRCAACGKEMLRTDFRKEESVTAWDIFTNNLEEIDITEYESDNYELRHTYHMPDKMVK